MNQDDKKEIIEEDKDEEEEEEDEGFEDNQEEEEEEDPEFDYGKAKMEYFKQRAREILLDEEDYEYENAPLELPNAYKSLKSCVRRPPIVHPGTQNPPHYLTSTFSMNRNAMVGKAGEKRFLEFSKISSKSIIFIYRKSKFFSV